MLENCSDVMTKKEVAEVLRISLSTLNTWCSRCPNKLPPYFKLGTAKNAVIRFKKEAVIAFIKNGGCQE